MTILSEYFFEQARRWVFWAKLILICLAFPLFRPHLVNYPAYINLSFVGLYVLLLVRKFFMKEPIRIDAISLFALYYLGSIFGHKTFTEVLDRYAMALIPLCYLAYYNLLRTGGKSKDTFYLALKIIVILGVTQSVMGFTQVLYGWPRFAFTEEAYEQEDEEIKLEDETDARNYFAYLFPSLFSETKLASGTFLHFNDLGTFLVMIAPIAFGLWLKLRKTGWLVAFIIIFWGIIFTFSRGALISGATAVMIVYMVFTRHKILKLYGMVVAVILLKLALDSFITEYVENTGNVDGRYDTWIWAIEQGMETPIKLIMGYGIGYYDENVFVEPGSVFFSLDNRRLFSNFHSMYVAVFLELGIVGSLLYVFAILSVVWRAFKHRSLWTYTLVGMMWGFSFSQAFDHSFFGGNGILFFTYIGLFLGYMDHHPREDDEADDKWKKDKDAILKPKSPEEVPLLSPS
ncbi:MAG: hypothetical protein HC880_01555 [Bacteroidia bacterium]|nr:hypothetical protein [Bacteroidia bacterium]